MYPTSRTLIVDSKPHFMAQWLVNGLSASPLYRKYDHKKMCYIPGSYLVPLNMPFKTAFNQIWRHKGRVAIIQVSKPGKMEQWSRLMECAEFFYGNYGHNPPRLIWVNELSDFFEIQKIGGIFWLLSRSGRELNVSFLGEMQRPRYIPKTVLTESDRMYIFELDNKDDRDALYDAGVPRDTPLPDELYTFLYYNKLKKPRVQGYFKLGGIE